MERKTVWSVLFIVVCAVFVSGMQGAFAQVPEPWVASDLGTLPTASTSVENEGVFTITAAGAFWDSPDAGHFVSQMITGDFEITAQVIRMDSVNEWSKVGLMIRKDISDSSRNAFVWTSPGHGACYQGRSGEGGSGEWWGGGSDNPLNWLKLQRMGHMISGFRSDDGVEWVQIGNAQKVEMDASVYVGMAVGSTADAETITAEFANVTIDNYPVQAPWVSTELGDLPVASTATQVEDDITITAAGAFWDSPDAGHFVNQMIIGDFEIVANITRMDSVNEWSKVGLMIRKDLSDSSRNAFVWTSPGYGACYQGRSGEGGSGEWWGGGSDNALTWLKLQRIGNDVSGFRSDDGVEWVQIGDAQKIDMDATVYVGLAVASTAGEATITATFSDIQIEMLKMVPDPWMTADLGIPVVPSLSMEADGVFTLTASGNFWDSPDVGHFVYQTQEGDFEIIANVTRLDSLNEWSKAGLMIRNDVSDTSRNAFVWTSPGHGACYQGRSGEGGSGEWWGGGSDNPLNWLKLKKTGDSVTGYRSDDGIVWVEISTQKVVFEETVVVGLAVASTMDSTAVTAEFEDVTIEPVMDSAVESGNSTGTPHVFALNKNYPNPFNPTTMISYKLPGNVKVKLMIYDAMGRMVTTLVDKKQAAGSHQVLFDAGQYASGVYFYRLETDARVAVNKMILMK